VLDLLLGQLDVLIDWLEGMDGFRRNGLEERRNLLVELIGLRHGEDGHNEEDDKAQA
jgi:hypothetical protein